MGMKDKWTAARAIPAKLNAIPSQMVFIASIALSALLIALIAVAMAYDVRSVRHAD